MAASPTFRGTQGESPIFPSGGFRKIENLLQRGTSSEIGFGSG